MFPTGDGAPYTDTTQLFDHELPCLSHATALHRRRDVGADDQVAITFHQTKPAPPEAAF